MYREVIEHPCSLPASIKQYLDLNSGYDRGRIYRVLPEGFRQPKLPRLSHATTAELVALLEHPNGWHRDTAARLLCERQDESAVPLLLKLRKNSRSPLARMHALCALDGLRALRPAELLEALGDENGAVRERAVRLAGETAPRAGPWSGRVWKNLAALSDDPDVRVRYQLAFTLGEWKDAEKINALAGIIRRGADDRWIRAAVLSSLAEGAGRMFDALTGDSRCVDSQCGREFLRQLVGAIGTQNDPGAVRTVLKYLQKNDGTSAAFWMTRALGDGLRNAGTSLARADSEGKLKPIFARAKARAGDAGASEQTRVEAVQLLALSSFDETGRVLSSLLGSGPPESLGLAAVAALARFSDPGVCQALLEPWPQLSARLRSEVVTVMLTRPERIQALFQSVERRTVLASDFTAQQLQVLRAHRDPKVRGQTIQLFGPPPAAKRDDVVKAFLPALELRGNPSKGKAIYLERCAACHRIGSQGQAVGPDLMTVKTAGKETLLINILDPNREVAPRYFNYSIETNTGESYSGMIANESPSSITLRGPNGTETVVLRSQIARLRASGQSVMPEGLEVGLTPQGMADLIEFLGVAD